MPTPEQYEQMYTCSPVSRLAASQKEKQTSPVLLHLGAGDRRVPHSQGLRWAETLISQGCEIDVIMFPGTGHALDSLDGERYGFESSCSFMIKHLKL